jgi:hypothetical protein
LLNQLIVLIIIDHEIISIFQYILDVAPIIAPDKGLLHSTGSTIRNGDLTIVATESLLFDSCTSSSVHEIITLFVRIVHEARFDITRHVKTTVPLSHARTVPRFIRIVQVVG